MQKINYARSVDGFEKGRVLSENKEMLWAELIREFLLISQGSKVLDIGCGTGRFSKLIANHFKSKVIGLDPSLDMLAHIQKNKIDTIDLAAGYAEFLPFIDNTFEICFASQILHHVNDKKHAVSEFFRVMSPGGRLGIRFSSHDQLRRFIDYRFFPSALDIDLTRMPDTDQIISILEFIGFSITKKLVVKQEFIKNVHEYIEKLQMKYSSVLSLIPLSDYENGLKEAINYCTKNPAGIDKYSEISFLIAQK